MKATARKRRDPRKATLARMEQAYERHLKGEDKPAPGSIDGRIGDVNFDEANTTLRSICTAEVAGIVRGKEALHSARVEIEIYPEDGPIGENTFITVRLSHYLHLDGNENGSRTRVYRDPQDLRMSARNLEPLAVALGRAVVNAKARGFLQPSDDREVTRSAAIPFKVTGKGKAAAAVNTAA